MKRENEIEFVFELNDQEKFDTLLENYEPDLLLEDLWKRIKHLPEAEEWLHLAWNDFNEEVQ